VRQKRVFLRERGFASVHLAAKGGEMTGTALTSNAAQVAGLGRIYFEVQRLRVPAGVGETTRRPAGRRRYFAVVVLVSLYIRYNTAIDMPLFFEAGLARAQ